MAISMGGSVSSVVTMPSIGNVTVTAQPRALDAMVHNIAIIDVRADLQYKISSSSLVDTSIRHRVKVELYAPGCQVTKLEDNSCKFTFKVEDLQCLIVSHSDVLFIPLMV